MEDIVNRLRGFKSAAAQSWAHEAADEIESLRAQLAEATRERDALKTVPMKYRRMKFNAELQEESAKLTQELLAAQAHAARMKEALKLIKNFSKSPYVVSTAAAALSTPINLDALHEALAAEADENAKIADLFEQEGIGNAIRIRGAAHRAKKDGH